MGKYIISITIFNSYVKLPEGIRMDAFMDEQISILYFVIMFMVVNHGYLCSQFLDMFYRRNITSTLRI